MRLIFSSSIDISPPTPTTLFLIAYKLPSFKLKQFYEVITILQIKDNINCKKNNHENQKPINENFYKNPKQIFNLDR